MTSNWLNNKDKNDEEDVQIWQTIMEQTLNVAKANRVRMFLIDVQSGWAKDINELGRIKARSLIPNSIAMRIMRDGEPGIIDSKANDADAGLNYLETGAHTVIGLPVSVDGERIGVMWFYYDDHRNFQHTEIEALQLYVNQAAIAYENAQRLKVLTHMRRATEVFDVKGCGTK